VVPDLEVATELAVAQAPQGHGNVVKMVPLKVEGTWWWSTEGDHGVCGEGVVTYPLAFEGTGTHLGRVTGTVTHCCMPDGTFQSHTMMMVGANGDILYTHGTPAADGTEWILAPDFDSWEILTVPLVGGTGRFQNVTGWYDLSGNGFASMVGSFTLEGMISSVGSSK
jgi:hypothetical protein